MALNNSNNSNDKNNNNNSNIDTDIVVRVDQDSDNNLQALFDSVLKPGESKRSLQVPLRMRKLPNSFFNPPTTGSKSPSASHSRANSTDSAFSIGSQNGDGGGGGGVTLPTVTHRGLIISHSRAHSSPASLQQTYEAASALNSQNNKNSVNATANIVSGGSGSEQQQQQQQQQTQQQNKSIQPVHMKQRSYDIVSAIQLNNELGDLPPGWEQARTPEGQIYYLNHITKTTQWEDPRTQLGQQLALVSQHHHHQHLQTAPPTAAAAVAKEVTLSNDPLGPLPEGWEQAVTSSGEIYFINHIDRTTSWFDPRISDYLERASSITTATRSEINSIGGGTSSTGSDNWVNIRNLEKEREYLKQRQQEIQNQDLLTRQNRQLIGLQQVNPFLSAAVTDHNRQESSDSGLGLPPASLFSGAAAAVATAANADFLSSINDSSMDCISENDDPITDLEGVDDLMPSLQLGDSGLCNDMLLTDVQDLMNPTPRATKSGENINWYKI